FILGFLGMAVLNTVGLFPSWVGNVFTQVSKFLILMAMAGVGLGVNPRKIRETGLRPMYLGLAASLVIAVASLTLVRLLD
ncbi:MAG: putative sulfate exporter family transporter, partial [Firmicutes bacterium]|nr:putative sulfate exporter family transporter [Bacillota bacterium]